MLLFRLFLLLLQSATTTKGVLFLAGGKFDLPGVHVVEVDDALVVFDLFVVDAGTPALVDQRAAPRRPRRRALRP